MTMTRETRLRHNLQQTGGPDAACSAIQARFGFVSVRFRAKYPYTIHDAPKRLGMFGGSKLHRFRLELLQESNEQEFKAQLEAIGMVDPWSPDEVEGSAYFRYRCEEDES